MPRIDIAGAHPTELHYTDTGGSGRPVVLVHGWPASEQSWHEVTPVLEAAGARVVAYDRRGFGQSGHGDGGYDYDTYAADLDALLTELDLREVLLVGFSMGGGEVARYVANHGGDRVSAAAFIAAITPCLDVSLPDNPEGGFSPDAAGGMQAGLRENPDGFLTEFLMNFYSVPGDEGGRLMVPQTQIVTALQVAHQAELAALVATIQLWLTDFRADLAALQVPTLVIHGDGDQIVPFQVSGERMPQYVPQARVQVIADGPHGLLASHPDEVAAALVEFLG